MNAHQEIFIGFNNVNGNLIEKTHRAGALLRLMQYRFKSGKRLDESEENDIGALVDVCLEEIPHHFDDVNDRLEELHCKVRKEMAAKDERAEHLENILNAMHIIAKPDATCEELTEAAVKVFNIAQADSIYEPDWMMLKETVEARGLFIEIMNLGGFSPWPEVLTKEMQKAKRKTKRRLASLCNAVNHETALSKHLPATA